MNRKCIVVARLLLVLVGVMGIFCLFPGRSDAAGFAAVGSMTFNRYHHTSTLLQNGKVLILGGRDSAGTDVPTIEIFDPATGLCTVTGSVSSRSSHTATVLANGKVLIVGGDFEGSSELYDPATGTLSRTGNLTAPRSGHTATLLPNGTVLIAGGYDNIQTLSTLERYDPATGTFTSLSVTLATPRCFHSATLLPSGKILIAGGEFASSAELFDPVSETSSSAGEMAEVRANHTATLLPNGMVLIAGGEDGTVSTRSADLYDPINGTFSPTSGTLGAARSWHSATLLPNGTVVLAGGLNGATTLDSSEFFDPGTGFFSFAGTMSSPRESHCATLLPGGTILLTGGWNNNITTANALASAERFDYAAGSFLPLMDMNAGRAEHTATVLGNGFVLLAGGKNSSGVLKTALLYNPQTGTFDPTGEMVAPRVNHTATLLLDGTVLITGGESQDSGGTYYTVSSAELYDPLRGTFTKIIDMNSSRRFHTATLLPDGSVLIAGGETALAELYYPDSKIFSQTVNNMASVRVSHTATLLADGNVLIAGGADTVTAANAELYNPLSRTFSPTTGGLVTARHYHSATLLPSGKVLIAGGQDDGGLLLQSAELYDPDTGNFKTTGAMASPRQFHSATLLSDGMVLLAGGINDSYVTITATERYDSMTAQFMSSEVLSVARDSHTATLLPSGNVLIAGGYPPYPDATASTELFDPGLGYAEPWRPAISSVSFSPAVPTGLLFAGNSFNGITEASGGSFNSSATNYPLLRFQRVDNDQVTYVLPDTTTSWTSSLFHSLPLNTLSRGVYRAALVANGIPSQEQLLSLNFALGIDPVSWDFGPAVVGTSPPARTITITNRGTIDLTVTSVTAGGDFSVLTTCASLKPAASCTATVAFSPTATGFQSTDLVIESTDPAATTVKIPLSGTGLPPTITIQAVPADRSFIVDGTEYAGIHTFSWDPKSTHALYAVSPQTGSDGNSYYFQSWSDGGNQWHEVTTPAYSANYTVTFAVNQGFIPLNSALPKGYYSHTATVLNSGKVLVTGGNNNESVMNGAWLFDPATGFYSSTGNLGTARARHTATMLPNGKVLVAGGYSNGAVPLASAEIYDPATGLFSATGSMTTTRNSHTATLLNNGSVLIVGGYGSPEIYNPASGTFSVISTAAALPLYGHAAALLPDGKVIIAGGMGPDSVQLNSALFFNPADNSFAIISNTLNARRQEFTATVLPTGQVLFAGGYDGNNYLNSAELFNPADNSFVVTGSLSTERNSHSATLLPNGKVLITGGYNRNNQNLGSAEMFNPATGTFDTVGNMSSLRQWHTATLLANGQVLIAGGQSVIVNQGSYAENTSELFNYAAGNFVKTGSLTVARSGHTSTQLATGKILVIGGSGSNPAGAELFDPSTGFFTATGAMSGPRDGHTATLLSNGTVLVVGGGAAGSEIYTPSTGLFAGTGSLREVRQWHSATQLANGKVLIAGGFGASELNSAELYDPATGSFTATGSLSVARDSHSATLLSDGTVLITGGYDAGNNLLRSAELFDPVTGTFSMLSDMNIARGDQAATLLPSGKVLVAGGNTPLQQNAELYDPVAKSFRGTLGSMARERSGHTATLLATGKVLIAGGEFDGLAEWYDPATDQFSSAGRMITARQNQTATLLTGGTVLLAGGSTGGTKLTSTELFDPGLGFVETWRPVVSSVAFPAIRPGRLDVTGSGFKGLSEASGGMTSASATNYPLLQLQRVEGDQTRFLLSDPTVNWSARIMRSVSVSGLPGGVYRATLYANGIPSEERFVTLAPAVGVSPSSHDFGSIATGAVSAPQSIFITNYGSADLRIVSAVAGSGFTVAAGSCGTLPKTLAPGAVCTVHVSFAPVILGPASDNLSITSNDPAMPVSTVALSGTGISSTRKLSVTITGSGTVNSTTPAYSFTCTSGLCSKDFPITADLTLTASPSNSVFSGWSGQCTNITASGGCRVTMEVDRSVTATFVTYLPARIGTSYYADIFEAYSKAPATGSSLIETQTAIFIGELLMNRGISVKVKGGYDAGYSPNPSGMTTVKGKVTIKSGTLQVDRLTIR